MKKILSTLALLLAFCQGLWAAPQTWESGNTICTLDESAGVFLVTAKEGTDGVMADYSLDIPGWRNYLNKVTQVVVAEGVTVIGEYTLPNLPEGVTISLPNTLKEIRSDAFRFGEMTSITIPSSVTQVAAGAFYSCNQLADVYCNASPYNLTWGGSAWDFIFSSSGWSYQTRMHVKSAFIDAFRDKFSGTKRLNVTFVGDLEPSANWIHHRAESFSEFSEKFHSLYIHNEAELALLAYNVNNGVFDYSEYYIHLESDLDLSDYLWTPIGTEDHPFKAIEFVGNNHTIQGLYINNPEGDYNGLFGYVKGTKIEGYWPDSYPDGVKIWINELKLTNSIVKGRNYTGGVIGKIYGQCEVQNVYSDAQVSGANYVGGVVGVVESQMNINLRDRYAEYLPVFANNAYVGSSITATGENHGAVMGGLIEYAKPTDNYYINPAVSSIANHYDQQLYPIRTSGIPENITVSITASKSLDWNGIRYVGSNSSGNTCDLTLDVKCGYTMLVTAVNLNGNVVATTEGKHTIQPNIGSESEYVVTVDANSTGIEGEGTEAMPYIIDTQAKWDTFANLVSTGHSTSGLYFRLDADLTVTTMAGSSIQNSFAGVFDGNNKTLTLNYDVTEEYAAPFRYIRGYGWAPVETTIKNLHVAGNITTSAKFAAGIVGLATGVKCIIENCRSSVAINSSVEGDGTHGGFVAIVSRNYSSESAELNLSGCVFDGKLMGSSTNSCGGMIGWSDSGLGLVSFIDCLFSPAEVTIGTDNSATFLRTDNYEHGLWIGNCFYAEAFGSTEALPASYVLTTRPDNLGTEHGTYSVSGITAYSDGMEWGGKYFVSYLLGDANGDGKVTVADVMVTVNETLGNQPSVFIFKNADVNFDNKVNVTDIMGIVKIITMQ